MKLAETQRLFWNVLQGQAQAQEVEACFRGSADLPAAERVGIYSNMYLWRLVDALREEFSKVAAFLGDDDFFKAMSAYVDQFPSESPDIGQLGRAMEVFLCEHDGGHPGLADLAALEWARSQVFSEAASEHVAATELASVPADRVPATRLRFVPALRFVAFEHDPLRVWKAIEVGEVPGELAGSPGFAAVWREGFHVFHTGLSAAEAEALQRALAGATLDVICDTFVGPEDAATTAFTAIARWFQAGWVAGIEESA